MTYQKDAMRKLMNGIKKVNNFLTNKGACNE